MTRSHEDENAADARCARLCHDLAGLAGTLAGTIEMAAEGDAEALELGLETARLLSMRLRLFRAAWAGAADPLTPAEIEELAAALPSADRITIDLSGLPDPLPPGMDRIVLNLLLLGGASLPMGGGVRVEASWDRARLSVAGRRVVVPSHPATEVLEGLGELVHTDGEAEWRRRPGLCPGTGGA